MKASDYVAAYLRAQGVTHVFELVGGMITHLLDSVDREPGIGTVSVHHEQAAAFAADATARMSGVPGVAMATSGPGATNLLTGIGSCYFDSSPAVFITGQVNRDEQRGNRAIRQQGFQETDIVSMAQPITKAAWQVDQPARLPSMLADAFALSRTGRPGPVLIDIPMDVQRAEVDAPAPVRTSPGAPPAPDETSVRQLLEALAAAERPLILAGGGLRSGLAVSEFRRFVDSVQVPVVNSLMAVDCLPSTHPLRIGLIGSYGNRWANHAIGRSDFLLVLGSRLDIRQTGSETEYFKGERTIFHVDVEAAEINNRVTGCHPVVADLQTFLALATQLAGKPHPRRGVGWRAEIDDLKKAWPDVAELNEVPGINPNVFMHQLSAASRSASVFVTDVGQHQMWAAQSVDIDGDQRFLTSGGMGSMGFALPAAVGAAMSTPGRPVVVIAGDGGLQVNIQELQTVRRNGLPIKIVVLNNRCHGMVRQFQQSYFDERYRSTLWGYSAPEFADVAKAYGLAAMHIDEPAAVDDALANLWSDPEAPFLLEVGIDTFANVYPKIAFGRPLTEMEPAAKPLGMEGT